MRHLNVPPTRTGFAPSQPEPGWALVLVGLAVVILACGGGVL